MLTQFRPGAVVDGYALVDKAPLEFIRGSRTREIEGYCVPGSYSEPWWAYNPKTQVYAVVKRWKSKPYRIYAPNLPIHGVIIAARDEVIVTPLVKNDSAYTSV